MNFLMNFASSIFGGHGTSLIEQAKQATAIAVGNLVAAHGGDISILEPAFTQYLEGRLGIAASTQNSLWTHLFGHTHAAEYAASARAKLEPEIQQLFASTQVADLEQVLVQFVLSKVGL